MENGTVRCGPVRASAAMKRPVKDVSNLIPPTYFVWCFFDLFKSFHFGQFAQTICTKLHGYLHLVRHIIDTKRSFYYVRVIKTCVLQCCLRIETHFPARLHNKNEGTGSVGAEGAVYYVHLSVTCNGEDRTWRGQ